MATTGDDKKMIGILTSDQLHQLQDHSITSDLNSIYCTLFEIEDLVITILCKINGNKEPDSGTLKNPDCIYELLEHMKIKCEGIATKLNQANNMI